MSTLSASPSFRYFSMQLDFSERSSGNNRLSAPDPKLRE